MAGITTDNFIITNPGLAGVRLLFGTGSNQGKVQGIIANTTDCNQNNYAAEFEALEVFNIFSTPFPIASRQAKTNHYYFEIHPPVAFDTGSITTPTICKDTTFVPSTVVDFTNNVYNVTFNSDQELRSSQYQFVVDSNNSGSSTRPSNIKAILADTAVTASVQDSNYSSLAVIRGRYEGAETGVSDYGILPAIAAEAKNGAIYDSSLSKNYICTQTSSTDIRPNKEFFFVPTQDSSTRVDSGSLNYNNPNYRYRTIVKGNIVNQNASVTGSELYLNFNTASAGVAIGDYLQLFGNTAGGGPTYYNRGIEFVKVLSLTQHNDSVVSASVKRNAIKDQFDSTIPFGTVHVPDNTQFHVRHVKGDQIYEAEGNKLFKVTDKKLYNYDTEEVFFVGEEGYILYPFGSCS
jgi:hypothetical protein